MNNPPLGKTPFVRDVHQENMFGLAFFKLD
jgi:hypothetical protein